MLFAVQSRASPEAGVAFGMSRRLKGELVAAGFPADEARLGVVVNFLLEQEVGCLADVEGTCFAVYWCSHVGRCRSLAGVPCFRRLVGANVLPAEDVCFLQSVANCRGMLRKRKALEPVASDAVSPEQVCVAPSEEVLFTQDTSQLDIASCGPRAAGKVLLQSIEHGLNRCLLLSRALVCVVGVGACEPLAGMIGFVMPERKP